MSLMGIITLFFLASFTLLYLNSSIENKPGFMVKAVDTINSNIDNFSLWAVIYGLIALVLTPLARVSGAADLIIRFLANALVVLMALPHTLDHLLEKYQGKVNDAIVGELRNLVSAVTAREKIVGYAGAGLSVLLFAFLFR